MKIINKSHKTKPSETLYFFLLSIRPLQILVKFDKTIDNIKLAEFFLLAITIDELFNEG